MKSKVVTLQGTYLAKTVKRNIVPHPAKLSNILGKMEKLKSKTVSQRSDIQAKIIKGNINIITNFIYNNFNNSLFNSYFPSILKNADITTLKNTAL